MTFTLATRASPLAMWQAHATRDVLSAADTELALELLEVRSAGDRDRGRDIARFGRAGVFTVEVDRALLDGRAQVGVHSLKDMTTTLEDGIVLAAVLPRGPVEDALVSRDGQPLAELERGARVATGSARRRAQLLAARADLTLVGIRGNVGTRLTKLEAGEAEALVMARAGLVRLGREALISEVLDVASFLPAAGQGIVGLTCRADDELTRERLAAINHRASFFAALAERSLLRSLQSGCNAPIGAHARVSADRVELTAAVLAADGATELRAEASGSTGDAEELGVTAAEDLLAAGAARLLEEARA